MKSWWRMKPFQIVITIHKDLTERLRHVDRPLYTQARAVLEHNKAERHLRGGEATRKRYANLKQN